MSKRAVKFVTLILVVGIIINVIYLWYVKREARQNQGVIIETCFTPQEDCTQFIVSAIKRLAHREILVQAYGFTSPPILMTIAAAKDNGLDVRVILDKSNEQERYNGGTCMMNHRVPVLIDYSVAIAHNKVVIIDRKHVITGSFNFTVSAQKRNAENVTLIENSPKVAARFLESWEAARERSRTFKAPDNECTLKN